MAQPQPSLVDELESVSSDLDWLIADMRSGRPSHTRHEGHVDLVEKLCARMRTAARGPGRSIHPPIGRTANGYGW